MASAALKLDMHSKLWDNANQLERMIDWRMGSLRVIKDTEQGEQLRRDHPMQRMFTIELRVDYADPGKNDAMRNALRHCARHAYAQAQLLADGVKPEVAIFSEDFFAGNEEISLLEDVITNGSESLGGTAEAEGVSDELAAAARGGI
jgi:hypothetical protein